MVCLPLLLGKAQGLEPWQNFVEWVKLQNLSLDASLQP